MGTSIELVISLFRLSELGLDYHSMTLVLRIGLDYAVCRRVIASSIHGIGPGFVERRLKLIASVIFLVELSHSNKSLEGE